LIAFAEILGKCSIFD